MQKYLAYLHTHPKVLYVLCALLLVPALFINLGLGAIMADEPTRALVALEMIISDNYVTPTVFGDFYYKKPPLFNWILVGLYGLKGDLSELTVRLPAVIPLLLYGGSIFWVVKKYLNWQLGFLAAIMMLTNGRMLIYDSMIGHIDILFSWVIWGNFMLIFYFWKKEQWLLLFVLSYLLTAVGFMLKGLPALVFQGLSLLSVFICHRQFRRLLYWQHVLGLGVLVLLLGSYFYAYSQYNSLDTYFYTLWHESSQRTVVEKSWLSTVQHLFTFPFELFVYHILPWSLLIIYVWRRAFWRQILQHDFLRFNLLLLGGNVWVYWLSPETHPRYLFMLYPLFFVLLAYAFDQYHGRTQPYGRWLMYLLGGIMGVASLAVWAVPFVEVVKDLPLMWLKVGALFVSMLLCTWLYLRLPAQRLVLFAIFLLLFRIGFDWFILSHRYITGSITQHKRDGLKVAEITGSEPLYVQYEHFNHDLAYYITRERMQILPKREQIEPEVFYMLSDSQLMEAGREYELYYEFYTRYHHTPMNLVKFRQGGEGAR